MKKLFFVSVLLFGFVLTAQSQNQDSSVDGLKIICKYDRADVVEKRKKQHNVVEVKNGEMIMDFKYAYIKFLTKDKVECCECEDLIQAENKKEVQKYIEKGYLLLEDPTRLMVLCKNPKYAQVEIEGLY